MTMHDLGLLRATPRYSRVERRQILDEVRRRWRSEYNAPEPDEELIANLISQSRSTYVQQEVRKAEKKRKRAARNTRLVRGLNDKKDSS